MTSDRERPHLAALVPAFDCSRTVGRVVRGIREHVSTVLVVDDGSADRTAATARRAGADVLRHPGNVGKGAAILDGLARLRERGFTHALTIDADGQHLPEEIPRLLDEHDAHPAAVVVGARRIESEVAAINRFGNRFADAWVWIATGVPLPDTQSGFRIYPIGRTLSLHPVGRRFDFETEVLIRAVRAGMDVRSVAVRVYYPPPDRRVSHYDRVWDTVRIIQRVVGLMLRIE
jgi:glycosyltransferase involved in cell wall biosynthesis